MFSRNKFEPEGNVKKIAVLRANALGDFIFILPALDALRQTYPEAEIVLLGKEWHTEFLKLRPGPVDRVVVVPPYRGVGMSDVDFSPAPELEVLYAEFFKKMQLEEFDLAVQLHGGGRNSNPFIKRLGARLSVGLCTPDAVPLDRNISYFYYQSEVLRYLEVVGLLGARTNQLEPQLTITNQDLSESFKVVPPTNDSLVVLHPGASTPRRRWPIEKFAQVCESLVEVGVKVVITGTLAEQNLIDDLFKHLKPQFRNQVQNLCNQLSINGLAGLLSRCNLIISNDSGPLHLAEAVGTATVGIYWCGNAFIAAPFSRERHRPAISWQLNCSVCGLDSTRFECSHEVSFVTEVSTSEVLNSAFDLLGLRR